MHVSEADWEGFPCVGSGVTGLSEGGAGPWTGSAGHTGSSVLVSWGAPGRVGAAVLWEAQCK